MPLEPLGRKQIVSPKNKTSKIITETIFFFAFLELLEISTSKQ
jgi:hypothetical protein